VCLRAATLETVVAAESSLPPEQVTAAFDAVVGNGAVLRSLAGALAEGPGVLQVGAPPVVGRLVGELVARGSQTFVAPACASCGRTDRKLHRVEGGGVCPACRHRLRARVCAQCGAVKPIASRTEAGEPICERCRRHTRGQRPCGVCAKTAAIAVRGRQGRPDVCVNCYRLPEAVCARCGQRRPCNFADDAQPICKSCAPRATTGCARCGEVRPPTARWPEGPVCEPCYRAALSHRGRCSDCQTLRRLVDPPGPRASRCAACAGVAVPGGHVCGDCGVEDRLFERGRCARCALARRARALLASDAEDLPDALGPVYEAIVAAPQPYSALNWLRTGAGAALLAEVAAGQLEATHQALDAHPRPRTADYLRRMLIAHGVLDGRDEELARAERWVAELLEGISRPADRRLVTAYATWRVLRRLRRRVEHNQSPWTATRHAKNQLGAAVALLDWLAFHERTLAEAGQADIDAWLATGPAAYDARDFLAWASEHGHSQPLTVPAPVAHAGTTLDADARWAILARLLHDDSLDLTDRVAGCLLLCYAQPLSRITALTLDQVTRRDDGTTTIRFGRDHIVVPEPLAGLLGALIDTGRRYLAVGAPATSRWLFPGALPGRPLTPARLGARLSKLGIHTRAGRRAALLHLAAQLPAAVLADLLNLSAGAAVGWVNNAGGDWSRYAAALVTERITNQGE
jgi:hypothetical protein